MLTPSPLSERERLSSVAEWYWPSHGFEADMVQASASYVMAQTLGSSALEIGPGTGATSALLAKRFERLVILEPTPAYADHARAILPDRVEIQRTLLEDYTSTERFDTVIAAHVLEHVVDPLRFLQSCRELLSDCGRLIVVVPNAGSLHRRIGVRLGALSACSDLTPSDVAIGHRRVYTRSSLIEDLHRAGMLPVHVEGHFLKPLSNALMDSLPDELRRAFIAVGDECAPDLCSEILIVAEVKR